MWVGERLGFARRRRGLSQQDVADAVGLSATAVADLENDRRDVSTRELSKLAEALGCSEIFLLEPDYSDHNLFPVLCQVLSETGNLGKINPPEQRVLDLCQEGEALRRFLGQPGTPALPVYRGQVTSAWMAVQQGGIVAQKERKRLGVGNGPLHDIRRIIGDQGIWAAAIELPKHLSGLLVDHTAIGTAVFVNREHGTARKRFSYAHEYAHALFDRDSSSGVIATRGERSDSFQEKRANAFAAAFLMPPDGIAEQLMNLGKGSLSRQAGATFDVASGMMVKAGARTRPGSGAVTHTDAATLAQHFGVSYEAMAWRLQNLGHISSGERNVFLTQREVDKNYLRAATYFSDRGADGEAPDVGEIQARITQLAIEAFCRRVISRGRLLYVGRKLAVDEGDLLDLAMEARQD